MAAGNNKRISKTGSKRLLKISVVIVLLTAFVAGALILRYRPDIFPGIDPEVEEAAGLVEEALASAGLKPGHIEEGSEKLQRNGLNIWRLRTRTYMVSNPELLRVTLALAELEHAAKAQVTTTTNRDASNHSTIIRIGGREAWRIRFLLSPEINNSSTKSKPLIAIVIDDVGSEWRNFPKLIEIDGDLTYAILPVAGRTQDAINAVRKAGREMMLHIPMEPKRKTVKLGPGGLWLGMKFEDLERIMIADLEAVPLAVGANNHMGSRFTAWKPGMKVVLNELKKRNMYFVDSVTGGHQTAYEMAREMGLKCYARDIFMDTYNAPRYVEKQLKSLISIAKKKGKALGIAHPRKATYEVLSVEIPKLEKKYGVKLVPASEIVEAAENISK